MASNMSTPMQLCRLCLAKDDVNIPIFNDDDVRQISSKIMACLPIQISRDDCLPQHVCDGCSIKLELFYQFWSMTLTSQKQLCVRLNRPAPNLDTNGSEVVVEINDESWIIKEETIYDCERGYKKADERQGEWRLTNEAGNEQREKDDGNRKFLGHAKDDKDTTEICGFDFVSAGTTEDTDVQTIGALGIDKIMDVKPTRESDSNSKKRYQCDVCGHRVANAGKLKNHMLRHTGEKPFKCKICKFTCSQGSALKVHMCRHSGEKPFKCSICVYKCTSSSALKIHMFRHTGEKRVKCTICEYKCSQRSSLRVHMRRHMGDKLYECNICDYKCIQSSTLTVHMRTHTGEKPYVCSVCDYRCVKSDSLKSHMFKHTGEKPFSCKICDFKCTRSYNLGLHMFRHTGEKPYECNLCDFRSAKGRSLKNHMYRHTGEKPYKCKICAYGCILQISLKQHMSKHSGETNC